MRRDLRGGSFHPRGPVGGAHDALAGPGGRRLRTGIGYDGGTCPKAGERVMLILTRRAGETLVIGDDVRVKVLEVKGQQVRIGVTAPREVAVHREEIYDRIRQGEGEQGGGQRMG